MKWNKNIGLFILSLCFLTPAYAQDLARIGERSILGTARYIGMGGAMSAIGGDPSSVHDNPAGLGLYRRMETQLTVGGTTTGHVSIPQASIILSSGKFPDVEQGVLFNNFMFSYRRLNTIRRTIYGDGFNGPSLGALLSASDWNWAYPYRSARQNESHSMSLKESGDVHEFAFDWAMNISNKWYIGAGIQIQSFVMMQEANYLEKFDFYSSDSTQYYNRNIAAVGFSGVGCSFSAGVIYRPAVWLRLGLSLQTPSFGTWNTNVSGHFVAQTDSICHYYTDGGWRDSNTRLMPLHTSASMAFQIGAYGLIALQYDYFYRDRETQNHSLRAGIEVIPVMGMYINAGYAFESPFKRNILPAGMDPEFIRQDTHSLYPQKDHYASFAIGYRGTHMMIQAAYQYRWQAMHLYAHEHAIPYDVKGDSHRIVVTIGWHQHY